MQALSFAVHVPLVCFGIAFPSMVLLVESLYVRTGDPLYRTLAKRWSKVMIALFAVGVVTGTILSFEMGLLWPNFMATFGGVFGLAFGLGGRDVAAEITRDWYTSSQSAAQRIQGDARTSTPRTGSVSGAARPRP